MQLAEGLCARELVHGKLAPCALQLLFVYRSSGQCPACSVAALGTKEGHNCQHTHMKGNIGVTEESQKTALRM